MHIQKLYAVYCDPIWVRLYSTCGRLGKRWGIRLGTCPFQISLNAAVIVCKCIGAPFTRHGFSETPGDILAYIDSGSGICLSRSQTIAHPSKSTHLCMPQRFQNGDFSLRERAATAVGAIHALPCMPL
eukprot:363330-Chlamydomonas_euryale.AAC.27